jgi:hypothetical protein
MEGRGGGTALHVVRAGALREALGQEHSAHDMERGPSRGSGAGGRGFSGKEPLEFVVLVPGRRHGAVGAGARGTGGLCMRKHKRMQFLFGPSLARYSVAGTRWACARWCVFQAAADTRPCGAYGMGFSKVTISKKKKMFTSVTQMDDFTLSQLFACE